MLAAGLGAEVGIERQQPIDAAGRGAEVLGDELGGVERNPAEMLVDFLQGGEDELLRLLKISVVIVGENAPDFGEIDSVFG